MAIAPLFTPSSELRPPRPPLKWAGGKRQLLGALLPLVEAPFGRYFEPFVGGGALFFALRPERAVLADLNWRLIRTYRAVRSHTEEVIAILSGYPHDRDFFLDLRAVDPDPLPDAELAAWMVYLNRTAFNGLYRVNKSGRFNVPFGRNTKPKICDAENLRSCAAVLRSAEILHADFARAVETAGAGDLVYFDPPYAPLTATSNFTAYTAGGFGPAEHERLRDVALDLKRRGARVIVSNSSSPLVRDLYGGGGFEIREVQARRRINRNADGRGPVTEFLIL